jgi:DNA adenine methylase
MIKSPIRYPGGKSRAAELIASIAPNFTEFREPFVGGGSVFVHLKQKFPNRQFWVNDMYFELANFWSKTQSDTEGVIFQVEKWRTEFPEGKPLYQFLNENMSAFNEMEKAAAFFIFNRVTFSGTTESGGFSQQAFDGRFTPSSIERLKPFGQVLKNTQITNFDYQQVVDTEGADVFIFLDPPYFSATKSALYGKNGHLHKGFDHARFAEVMKKCSHKWLITYDDSPYIRQLFSFAHIMNWNLTYGMRNVVKEKTNQKASEVFISNYIDALPSEKQTTLFETSV